MLPISNNSNDFAYSPSSDTSERKNILKTNPTSECGFFNPRVLRAFALCSASVFLALLSSSLLVPKASAQTVSGASFTAAGTMTSPRVAQTATLLGNGKVLMTGGTIAEFTMTNTAELFDPASGTFTSLFPNHMFSARAAHTATLLPSGKVLIAGGFNYETSNRTLTTAELFDPATGTFTSLPSMTTDRRYHTATLLPNGKVLIAGGYRDTEVATHTAEIFDPATETFTPLASTMILGRGDHTATLLPNGKVLIVGGYTCCDATGLDSRADLFDPATGTFTPTVFMGVILFLHTATLLPNGKVLIAGGYENSAIFNATNAALVFDPALGIFTPLPPMTLPRMYHTATLLPSGKVLITGGALAWLVGPYILTNTAELFDPVTGTFTSLSPGTAMTTTRIEHTATLLPNGKVLIAGGGNDGFVVSISNTAELFDSPTDRAGFSEARRPVISTAPSTLIQPASLVLTGTGFRGDSEGSGGSFANSATNYPLVQLTRIDNEQSFFVLSDPATNWSDTSFTSETLSNLPSGQYRVTVFTNAIPSLPKIINIALPVPLVSVVSRKVHGSAGTFDINLPLTGTRGVECRSGGANGNYQMVFTFVNNVTNCGSASIGSLSSGPNPNQCTVDLTGVANQQYITVTLNNVLDSQTNTGNVAATMGVLIGDTSANGLVNSTDVSQTQAQSGKAVTGSNFRTDVNANGLINSTDVSLVQSKSGTGLP
jgi:hypothetical protein